ncbi:MAG TPA: 1-acyl-sn-glycerol-3-phosphate acyltransferase [Leptospiraceae bacterium]|nr:1-acyl-sn-glycerol-3-phosphate acyltransferase [Leptospiraceae bacterium]HNN58714.1 1-acyl-sn-glycerol-3-phosphate acyltransferase [Leptospiraceae bacterium]
MTESAKEPAATHAPWQREFFKNIEGFMQVGIPEDKAKEILMTFLKLSSSTPMPRVMESFRSPEILEEVGVHTKQNPELRDFMATFLDPVMRNFTVEGLENLSGILPLLGKYPMTLISNHLSHLDAPAIYNLLYRQGGDARKLADSLVFIAGRLAFEPDFTRLGLYMFDTLLVCSKLDMTENPGLADLMTRINMRAFRHANQLQKEGKIIAIFPEGTRSRTGKLVNFVDTVYHYVANKIIVPVSLAGTEEILPTQSFLFNASKGKLVLGKPVLVGDLPKSQMASLPEYVQRLAIPEVGDKKQFVIDNLALLIGQNLHKHRHGTYRNLYRGDDLGSNVLITRPRTPTEKVVVLGHSPYGTAAATILANKNVSVQIYLDDEAKVAEFNEKSVDLDHFPLFKLPPNISYTANPAEVESGTLFVQAARSWELDRIYSRVKLYLQKANGPILNIVKGFTGSKYGLILDDLEHFYELDPKRFVAIAGANYPEQVMERKLTGYEVAANNPDLIDHICKLFSTGYVFTRPAVVSDDVRGVQLGGALKNIYALGIGLLDGYYEKSLGGNTDNSLFHVSNRIFKEMKIIGSKLGGKPGTFEGLSGLTDLMMACFGQDSRDRQYGHDYIYGKANPDQKTAGLFGVRSLPNLLPLNPEEYPVASAVHAVLVQKRDYDSVLNEIMSKLKRF